MNRIQVIRCLKAHGLKVQDGYGGDSRVVTEKGTIIFAYLPLRKKQIGPGCWNTLRRCASRVGINLPSYSQTKRKKW